MTLQESQARYMPLKARVIGAKLGVRDLKLKGSLPFSIITDQVYESLPTIKYYEGVDEVVRFFVWEEVGRPIVMRSEERVISLR